MSIFDIYQSFCPEKISNFNLDKKLGNGVDGEVYSLNNDPNKVIKLCVLFDVDEDSIKYKYDRTRLVLDTLIEKDITTYAKVYSYSLIGCFCRNKKNHTDSVFLYYYFMERLYELSEDEKRVFHSVLSHEDRGINKNYSLPKIKEMLGGMSTALDFDLKKVIYFCTNFRNSPINHLDVHVRNIMKDLNGNFKLIDFDRVELKGK